jgi:hypothetical protein
MTDFDPYNDKLFEKYIERKPRCKAVELRQSNVWDVAQYLVMQGWNTQVSWTDGDLKLDLKRDDVQLTASIEAGDALMINGYYDVELIPGSEFRRNWEKEL